MYVQHNQLYAVGININVRVDLYINYIIIDNIIYYLEHGSPINIFFEGPH
jgi:hypothetical protein